MINVDEIFEEARVAFDAGRYPEVMTQLNDAVLEESAHPQLYFLRGMARYNTTRMDEKAIEDLTMAIALKPDYFRAILYRGRIWAKLRQHSNAIADLALAVKIRPDNASAYRQLGMALNEKRDYDKAILHFNTAIELEPDSVEGYLQRSTAYLGLNQYKPAIEDLDNAIALNPDYASAYTSRGHALYNMKEYALALENFNNAIRINPLSGRAYLGLGKVYEVLEEFSLASTYFKRAFFLNYDGRQLVDLFREKFPAPYIVKSIVAHKEERKKVEPSFATLDWLLATCKEWDQYLQHLRDRQDPVTRPELFYRLEAMVNFYMGNPIASYRIFDTKFDADEYPYPMTLQDQYYLVLSALDFNEPDNGLAYALTEAAEVMDGVSRASDPDRAAGNLTETDGSEMSSVENLDSTSGNPDSATANNPGRTVTDLYYAGQLFLLNGDVDSALPCFDRCAAFLPALYGKLSIYALQGDTSAALVMAERIAAAEASSGGFLDGIQPLTIGSALSLEEGLALLQRQIYYYEWQEAIAIARELLQRSPLYQHLPFHSLLLFAP